jgi:hypothetical protein
MTADVLRMGPAHDEVEALLPWFVNGTLEADDQARVLCHLDECVDCRDEVDALRAFQTEYVQEPAQPDSKAAFARLAAALGQPTLPWHARARRKLIAAWRAGGQTLRPDVRRWLPWAVGLQLVLVAAIGTFAALYFDNERALSYRTLSVPEAASTRAGSIVVRFDPKTSEDELRRIVRAANARIVDGPTAADAYVLDVAGGDSVAAVQALRAQSAVVLAEPLRSER